MDGQEVETLVSQFVAYLDGRIHEVALDWYAQDDAGNVWYFGEDVFNYEDGVVADTEGTWIAGEDGPPGMIMPADPQVGQVYRPENIPDFVFEEVVVKTVDLTVEGPRGPVEGAIVGTENHLLEGHYEDKTFAPGYGEFTSGVGANLEALALAVPTDAQSGGVPAELEAISSGAADIFAAAEAGDWEAATATLAAMTTAWAAHRATGTVPPLLDIQLDQALDALAGNALMPAVEARNPEGARNAALAVAMALEVPIAMWPSGGRITHGRRLANPSGPPTPATPLAPLRGRWQRRSRPHAGVDRQDPAPRPGMNRRTGRPRVVALRAAARSLRRRPTTASGPATSADRDLRPRRRLPSPSRRYAVADAVRACRETNRHPEQLRRGRPLVGGRARGRRADSPLRRHFVKAARLGETENLSVRFQ